MCAHHVGKVTVPGGRQRVAAVLERQTQEAGAQALLSEEQARELAASELQAMRRERRTRP